MKYETPAKNLPDKLAIDDFQIIFEKAPIGIFILELDGSYLYANEKWQDICSDISDDAFQQTWEKIIHPEFREEIHNEWQHVIQTNHIFQAEFKLVASDMKNQWVLCTGQTVALSESSRMVCLMTVNDITKRRKIQSSIHMVAAYDPVTGLANRTYFLNQLKKAFQNAQRQKDTLVLFFIDLDDFKDVNDTYGHEMGDVVLKSISDRFLTQIRKTDILARYGGDEFVLLLNNVDDPLHISATAKKIQDVLKAPIKVDGKKITLTSSIGIAVAHPRIQSYRELISQADTAMYLAKDLGRNNFKYYTEELNTQVHRKIDISSYLSQAMEKQELSLVYQPQIEIKSLKIVGVEVLMRWKNEILGSIAPSEFIPLAEENGLIEPLTDWMFERIIKETKHWQDFSELKSIPISINVSTKLFREDYVINKLQSLVNAGKIDANKLTLDIQEELLINYPQETMITLKALKKIGVNIALDDFGIGFSSITTLKKFPIDVIKLNQTFIKDVLTERSDTEMTQAIIALANSLNLSLVAEGVESEEVLSFLKENDCLICQGNYFSMPLLSGEFLDWYKNIF